MTDINDVFDEVASEYGDELEAIEELAAGSEVPTGTPTQPDRVQQPSTEGQQEYIAPGEEGFVPRPGVTGAIQDIAEGTVRGLPKNLY